LTRFGSARVARATAGKGFDTPRSFGLAEKDLIKLYAESYAKEIVAIAKSI